MYNAYEESVLAIRNDSRMLAYVQRHYLDADLQLAVARYVESKEFQTIFSILAPKLGPDSKLLDLGVGRGLTSLAFSARNLPVFAVEYDASPVSGLGALARYLQAQRPASLNVTQADGLRLPFRSGSFDVVFCRSVLHHLNNLGQGVQEAYRVLKPGGLFLAWNEHIASIGSSKKTFMASHPAVAFGVNENAYSVPWYWWQFHKTGFRNIRIDGHYLGLSEFASALKGSVLRAKLAGGGSVERPMTKLLHYVHRLRRTILVDERDLPVVCIVGQKPS